MTPEIHLFLIWSNARPQFDKIKADLRDRFEPLSHVDIRWSAGKFARNMTRFYGTHLPSQSYKEIHCGNGPFAMVLVRDNEPLYAERKTSRGPSVVNTKVFDAKVRYREWTGGGHRIHATNSVEECRHDVALLTGLSPEDFLRARTSRPDGELLEQDLAGAHGWSGLRELFSVLDLCTRFVVLRNFESMPDRYTLEGHGDIDLLCEKPAKAAYVLDAERAFPDPRRMHYFVSVNKQRVPFDLRTPEDRYMEPEWSRAILRDRVGRDGFFVPTPNDYFYSLLYHAMIHKRRVSEDYLDRLSLLAPEVGVAPADVIDADRRAHLLNEFMRSKGYRYCSPVDTSVNFFVGSVGGFAALGFTPRAGVEAKPEVWIGGRKTEALA
ncbi:MAG: hypothetical protein KF691_11505 [Phycisphaeraceae bacterium]|nr:hypothetical protein [Phycisphaeraceae bacterium]